MTLWPLIASINVYSDIFVGPLHTRALHIRSPFSPWSCAPAPVPSYHY